VQREKVKLIKIKGCFFNKRNKEGEGVRVRERKKRERERKERSIMTKMKVRFCGRITKYVNLLFNSLIKAV
jgi:hypothetical protein